ncbi:MAG: iron-sulfur cluster repair protein YtfE [Pseudomonas sp.]
MSTALIDQTLGSIVSSLAGATRVLRHYQLDFCCAGNQSLAQATAQRELDAEQVVLALEALDANADGNAETDWRGASSNTLIEHICRRFHDRHRQQLPELIRLATRVEQVHGSRSECPNGLAEHLWNMQQELESHMLKEEQILFPMLQRGIPAEQVHGPLSVLRYEHEQHLAALQALATLTQDITAPAQACNTWRALYRGLEELRDDLMQHIHLENNILFAGDTRHP